MIGGSGFGVPLGITATVVTLFTGNYCNPHGCGLLRTCTVSHVCCMGSLHCLQGEAPGHRGWTLPIDVPVVNVVVQVSACHKQQRFGWQL
jgi:hypothetical protein